MNKTTINNNKRAMLFKALIELLVVLVALVILVALVALVVLAVSFSITQ